jgi:hypothetical protein
MCELWYTAACQLIIHEHTRLIICLTPHWCFVFDVRSSRRSLRPRVALGITMRTWWLWLTFGWTWGSRAWNEECSPNSNIPTCTLYYIALCISVYVLSNASTAGKLWIQRTVNGGKLTHAALNFETLFISVHHCSSAYIAIYCWPSKRQNQVSGNRTEMSNAADTRAWHRTEMSNAADTRAWHRTEMSNAADTIAWHRTEMSNAADTRTWHRTEMSNAADTRAWHRTEMSNAADTRAWHRSWSSADLIILSFHILSEIPLYVTFSAPSWHYMQLIKDFSVLKFGI